MAEREIVLNAKGMHCPSCSMLVEMGLSRVEGVKSAKVDYANETAKVSYDDELVNTDALVAAVNAAGYEGSVAE